MILSASSDRVPDVGECFTCPYRNKCNGGDKCFLTKEQQKRYQKYLDKKNERYRTKRAKKNEIEFKG